MWAKLRRISKLWPVERNDGLDILALIIFWLCLLLKFILKSGSLILNLHQESIFLALKKLLSIANTHKICILTNEVHSTVSGIKSIHIFGATLIIIHYQNIFILVDWNCFHQIVTPGLLPLFPGTTTVLLDYFWIVSLSFNNKEVHCWLKGLFLYMKAFLHICLFQIYIVYFKKKVEAGDDGTHLQFQLCRKLIQEGCKFKACLDKLERPCHSFIHTI